MPELVVRGRKAWYRHGSDAVDPSQPCVVFLHGVGASSLSWIYQLRALRRTLGCVALDLPGHGRSDDEPCATIGDYAQWVVEVIETLGHERVFVVGHSMGGAIAVECALRAAPLLEGIVVMSAGPVIPLSPLITEALAEGDNAWGSLMNQLIFSPTTPQRFVDKSSASDLQAPRRVAARDFAACQAWDRRGQLDSVMTPALVLAGRDDALTPAPLVEALALELPFGHFEAIDDAGHMLMIEQHKRVNELLDAFVHRVHSPQQPLASA